MTRLLAILAATFALAGCTVDQWVAIYWPDDPDNQSNAGCRPRRRPRGVAMVGRPVARHYDDGLTLEVNRTATDGTLNANSMLYGTAWRAAKALGYQRLITYTQRPAPELIALWLMAVLWGWPVSYPGESGSSLRAAGWDVVAERSERKGWNTPSRPREGRGADGVQRTLWEAVA